MLLTECDPNSTCCIRNMQEHTTSNTKCTIASRLTYNITGIKELKRMNLVFFVLCVLSSCKNTKTIRPIERFWIWHRCYFAIRKTESQNKVKIFEIKRWWLIMKIRKWTYECELVKSWYKEKKTELYTYLFQNFTFFLS